MMIRTQLITAIGVLTLLLGAAAWQVALAQPKPAEHPILVINFTAGKEDLHKALMALQLANHGLTDGRKVVIFLNVRAPELAAKNAPDTWIFGKNPPVPQMLRDLIKRGATVLVCPTCMDVMNLKTQDLCEGVQVATRDALFGNLGPQSAVFSY